LEVLKTAGLWLFDHVIEYGYDKLMETVTSIPMEKLSAHERDEIAEGIGDITKKQLEYEAAYQRWMSARTKEDEKDKAWNDFKHAEEVYVDRWHAVRDRMTVLDARLNDDNLFRHRQLSSKLPVIKHFG
jgi:hypothetical protein